MNTLCEKCKQVMMQVAVRGHRHGAFAKIGMVCTKCRIVTLSNKSYTYHYHDKKEILEVKWKDEKVESKKLS